MYCRECGTKLDDNQKFCQNCGTDQVVKSSIKNQTISEQNKSTYINDTNNRQYTIDMKMYIGACIGVLGTILLCVLPFMKSGYIELGFFDAMKMCKNRDEYVLFLFIMLFLFVGIFGILDIVKIMGLPKIYSKYIQSGKEFRANKLLNWWSRWYKKDYLVACLSPLVLLIIIGIKDSDDIKYLSTGFWLCSLCLVVEGILFFISEPPTEEYIKSYVLNYETIGNTWICKNCDESNSISTKYCYNCGAAQCQTVTEQNHKSETLKQKYDSVTQSEQIWTCTYCSHQNSSSKSTCTNCGKFRG